MKNDISNITIVLFTSIFPYEGGEAFLETEIKYLSKSFKQIIILPTKKNWNIRNLPANVSVDNSIANSKTRYLYKLKSLFGKYFLSNFSINVNELKYLFKNAVYVENIRKWIEDYLEQADTDETLFYSYWFEAPTAALALVKSKNHKLKFITRVHGGDLYENLYNLNTFPFRQKILNNINYVFPVAEKGKQHLTEKYEIDISKISTSYLGVENPNTLSGSSKDGKLRIVSCSNLIPLKRVNLIIQSLAELKNKNIEIIWTHIGDGELRNDLENLAKQKLSNNIRFKFLGLLKNPEVLNFYKSNPVDVFINVSSSEGIPVSIMEAQSFGIPVIATNVGAVKEIVNNENGFLLNRNPTAGEIAKIILFVATNKNIWQKKRTLSYQNWTEKFNAEKNYNNFINYLKEEL